MGEKPERVAYASSDIPGKGKIGEEMVREFLKSQRFAVSDSTSSKKSDSDLTINGKKVEVKFSTLWKKGYYTFQQIRDQEYDILLCLGISPDSAHSWVVPKSMIVWDDLDNQHGGSRGGDTWWISFPPTSCPHSWMKPQNGELSAMLDELRKLTG